MLASETAAQPERPSERSRLSSEIGKSAMIAAAVTHTNHASRQVRNAKMQAKISSASWKGSIFFCQPKAKKAPTASRSST